MFPAVGLAVEHDSNTRAAYVKLLYPRFYTVCRLLLSVWCENKLAKT